MEGRDLMPRIREDRPLPPMPMFSETYGIAVFNVFPGIKQLAALSRPSTIALRQGPLKITYTFKSRSWQMFDLTSDPDEKNGSAGAANPDFVRLAEMLKEWNGKHPRPRVMGSLK
jgi:hypothetical protein